MKKKKISNHDDDDDDSAGISVSSWHVNRSEMLNDVQDIENNTRGASGGGEKNNDTLQCKTGTFKYTISQSRSSIKTLTLKDMIFA